MIDDVYNSVKIRYQKPVKVTAFFAQELSGLLMSLKIYV